MLGDDLALVDRTGSYHLDDLGQVLVGASAVRAKDELAAADGAVDLYFCFSASTLGTNDRLEIILSDRSCRN